MMPVSGMTYTEKARTLLLGRLPALGAWELSGLLDLYTLLVLVKGEAVTVEDVHDAWSVSVRCTSPDHPSVVPFVDLPWAVQERDAKYAAAVRVVAIALAEQKVAAQ